MFSYLLLKDFKTININYLLNKGQLKEAIKILTATNTKLNKAYY